MAQSSRLTEATVRDYLSRGVWQPGTLSDYWDKNASKIPHAIAVTDGERALSWAQAKVWTDRLALALVRLGLGRDELLVVELPNCVELPLIRVACEKAGVISLPVPRTWRQNEMDYCLQHTAAAAVIVPWRYRDFDYFEMMRELSGRLPHLRLILVAGKEIPEGAFSLDELLSNPAAGSVAATALDKRRYRSEEVSLINATTGSTGLPRFAEYTAAARLLYGRSYIETLGLTVRDVLAALSPAAGGPNIPAYFAAPQIGAKTVFLGQFAPEAAFALIEQERVTVACVVPTQLAMMVHHPHSDQFDLSSVRFWLSVGAPLPSNLAQQAEEELGGVVLNTYGAVDWGGIIFTSPRDPPEIRYFTVGKPRAGTEVRLVDEEGDPVADERSGELQGRGPACSSGYYRDPESTRRAWTADGWMLLGDVARWDGSGNLILLGRRRDLILRGGENIAPIEIENLLLLHPKVRQVAVLGLADSIFGERVCACVVPRGDDQPTFEEIISFLRSKKIASYKLPEQLEVMDTLPMISDTKVDRRALQAALSERVKVREGS